MQKTVQPGEWIYGRGWHQEKWTETPVGAYEGYPTHQDLSEVSPDNPVMLVHASGHSLFANDQAMKVAGITPYVRVLEKLPVSLKKEQ